MRGCGQVTDAEVQQWLQAALQKLGVASALGQRQKQLQRLHHYALHGPADCQHLQTRLVHMMAVWTVELSMSPEQPFDLKTMVCVPELAPQSSIASNSAAQLRAAEADD